MPKLHVNDAVGDFVSHFPGLAETVAAEFGCLPSELLAGGRLESLRLSEARALAAWVAHQTGGVSFPLLAKLLGLQYPATRARVAAVARRRERDAKFRKLCDRLVAMPGLVVTK